MELIFLEIMGKTPKNDVDPRANVSAVVASSGAAANDKYLCDVSGYVLPRQFPVLHDKQKRIVREMFTRRIKQRMNVTLSASWSATSVDECPTEKIRIEVTLCVAERQANSLR